MSSFTKQLSEAWILTVYNKFMTGLTINPN